MNARQLLALFEAAVELQRAQDQLVLLGKMGRLTAAERDRWRVADARWSAARAVWAGARAVAS